MENTFFNQHRIDKYVKNKSFKIKPSQHDLIKKHIEKLEKGKLKHLSNTLVKREFDSFTNI